jgi:hypothetical protein|tara:strand:- start:4109 stop:4387 length:279 start_codon:yes stop_codon:yes gene_type:complete
MSQREDILRRLVDILQEKGLGEVYGIIEGISPDNKYRSATFCQAKVTDGEVRVYGPKFIQVNWTTANRSLPHKGSEIFKSEEDAINFIKNTF